MDPAFAEAWYNLGDLLDEQGVPKPPSNVYAKACRQRLTTQTPCSTWLCCCNEKINAPRLQITGGATSLSTANRNGLAAHGDH
jgi:hypothetical protein